MEKVQAGVCSCGRPVMLTPRQAQVAARFGFGAKGWERACDACAPVVARERAAEEAVEEAGRVAAVVRSRMTESRMPEALLGQRVPGAAEDDPECERLARLAALRWAHDTDAPPMLLLWGAKGRGKTVLAAEAFAYALRRRPGRWHTGIKLVRDLYGEYESAERLRAESTADGRTMVVLDDVDKVMGERSGEQLFGVVDALYARGTPMIVTMNGTPDEAARRWGAVGEMIADRLASAEMGKFEGPSWRRRSTWAA